MLLFMWCLIPVGNLNIWMGFFSHKVIRVSQIVSHTEEHILIKGFCFHLWRANLKSLLLLPMVQTACNWECFLQKLEKTLVQEFYYIQLTEPAHLALLWLIYKEWKSHGHSQCSTVTLVPGIRLPKTVVVLSSSLSMMPVNTERHSFGLLFCLDLGLQIFFRKETFLLHTEINSLYSQSGCDGSESSCLLACFLEHWQVLGREEER